MLERIQHGSILELRLARPPVNALDPALVAQLIAAVRDAPGEGARAIVLSGAPGLFSAGLDVPVLLTLDREKLAHFWRAFFELLSRMARCPVPIVAAISGHSPAGGAVLSIFCDYRIMAEGAYKIGLNEVQVGLSVPPTIQFALRRLVGAHRAERLMVAGAMIDAAEALRIGMVDELAQVDNVVPRALAWCEQHLALPPLAMAETRRQARADLHEGIGAPGSHDVEDFVDAWYGAETQSVLKALVDRLKRPK
ncbi:MAG: enoyl-CoA hydratase/isomerase family protein [Lysobacterales bacterium]